MKIDIYEDSQKFTDIVNSGDPVRDFYDESDIHEALEHALRVVAYLSYFYQECDFGPAHSDVIYIINEGYDGEIPQEWRDEE